MLIYVFFIILISFINFSCNSNRHFLFLVFAFDGCGSGSSERCSMMSLHGRYGCSWTFLWLLESLSFSKRPINLIPYRGAVGSFSNRHSAREIKYRNLSLQSHYHNNSGFLFTLLLTVFLVVKYNTCNETKNSKDLSFFVAMTKIW